MKFIKIKNPEKIWGVTKVILGTLGILLLVVAILTLTNVIETLLIKWEYPWAFTPTNKLTLSLTSSILSILFLFIAFANQIDKFFSFIEEKEIKVGKNKETKGVTLESIFFLIIAIVLMYFALTLGLGKLPIGELPLLKGATDVVIISALVILSLAAIFTAFNSFILQSLKEMNKVQWPTGAQMADYSVKVFTFIIFFTLLFLLFDVAIVGVPQLVDKIFK